MNRTHIAVLLTVPTLLLFAGCSGDTSPPLPSLPTPTVSTSANTPPETTPRTTSPDGEVPLPDRETPGSAATRVPTAPPPAPAGEDCGETLQGWNNAGPKGTGEDYGQEDATVIGVNVGQHACFDQVTISIGTTAAIGSHFEYVNSPSGDATGVAPNPPIAGGVVLQGSVFVWSKGLTSSGVKYQYRPDEFVGWEALREVRYDTSHEGHTSFFIGVVSDNAFRMRSWQDGGVRKIIIQIAH